MAPAFSLRVALCGHGGRPLNHLSSPSSTGILFGASARHRSTWRTTSTADGSPLLATATSRRRPHLCLGVSSPPPLLTAPLPCPSLPVTAAPRSTAPAPACPATPLETARPHRRRRSPPLTAARPRRPEAWEDQPVPEERLRFWTAPETEIDLAVELGLQVLDTSPALRVDRRFRTLRG